MFIFFSRAGVSRLFGKGAGIGIYRKLEGPKKNKKKTLIIK